MSKSRFDGGTLGNGRWDEEEHPRGKDGRFAVAGGGDSGNGGEGASGSMSKEKIKNIVSEEAEKIGTGYSVEQAAKKLYFRLTSRFDGTGVHVSGLNERYILVGGMAFSLPRRRNIGHYTAKVFSENYK